jgi:hypothetical protein
MEDTMSSRRLLKRWRKRNLRDNGRNAANMPVTVYAPDGRHQCLACDVSDSGMLLMGSQPWPFESVLALNYFDPTTSEETVALAWVRHRHLFNRARTRDGRPLVTLGLEFLDAGAPAVAA